MKEKSIYFSRDYFKIIILIICFISIYFINIRLIRPVYQVSKQDSAVNFNPIFLKSFSLGNNRLISSFLWIQTLLEADLEHYKAKDTNSWIYIRLRTIIELDPMFYEAYQVGGQYLSIVKDDDIGAKVIYNLGLAKFPNDFWLNYYAGFHYYFELSNIRKSISLLKTALQHPIARTKFTFLPSLVAKMEATRGDLYTAFSMLKIAYDKAEADTSIKSRLYKSLYAVKAEIDLNCLNEKSKKNRYSCSIYDFDKNLYINIKNNFYAKKKWKKFILKKKDSN